ncbi:MAG: hypothetical protein KDK30_04465 [Leptospiraceae bacterium]|nr:hypothetical protein [Leptospiraceae bacterium]
MSRWRYPGIIAGLVLLFVCCMQAIVSVKIYELRMRISQNRILNFELSSSVLRERFLDREFGDRENLTREARRNVIESTILNEADDESLRPVWIDYVGLFVVNTVRWLSFKPALALIHDREVLLRLRFAFYMERKKRYQQAAGQYRKLARMGSDGNPQTAGFIDLHYGFCLAMAGEHNHAARRLQLVIKRYPGTHYAQTAAIILGLLEEHRRKSAVIADRDLTDLEKARLFYEQKMYRDALDYFNRYEHLLDPDLQRKARSLEETGDIKAATDLYNRLVNQSDDSDIVRDSNRRLLMIGHFYGGGRELADESEARGRRIGDGSTMDTVRTTAQNSREDYILTELKDIETIARENDIDLEELEDLRQELVETVAVENDLTRPLRRPEFPAPARPPEVPLFSAQQWQAIESMQRNGLYPLKQPDIRGIALPRETVVQAVTGVPFQLELRNGRQVQGSYARFESTGLLVHTESLRVRVPYFEITGLSVETTQATFRLHFKDESVRDVRIREFSRTGLKVLVGNQPREYRYTELNVLSVP